MTLELEAREMAEVETACLMRMYETDTWLDGWTYKGLYGYHEWPAYYTMLLVLRKCGWPLGIIKPRVIGAQVNLTEETE